LGSISGNTSIDPDSFTTGIARANLQDSVDYLLHIAAATVRTFPERTFENASRARDLCIENKLTYDLVLAYKYMGEAKIETEEYYEAQKYLQEASLLLADQMPKTSGNIYFLLGKAKYYLGEYEDANTQYLKALKLFEAENRDADIAKTLQNIGLIHHSLDNKVKASYYYHRALDINLKIGNDTNIAGLYQNLGIIYYQNDDFEKALDYYEKSIHIYNELNQPDKIATTFSNIGLIQLKQEEYENAFESFHRSYELFESADLKLGKLWTLHNCGTAKLYLEHFDDARDYYNKSLELARDIKNPEGIISNLNALTELSEQLQDFKSAFYYFSDYTEIRDSIHSSDLKERVAELETLYSLETQEKELAEKNAELRRQKTQKSAILIVLFFMGIALSIIYLAYREKKLSEIQIVSHKLDLENSLVQKNKELENQITERKIAEESDKLKSAFLANMSHELRTPMNAIIAFSNFMRDPELSQGKRDEYLDHITTAGDSLLRLIDDIIDIAKLEARQLKISISPVNINRLLRETYKVFTNIKSKNKYRAVLKLNIDTKIDYIVNTDAIRVKQVVSNLLDNAFKYTPSGTIEFGMLIGQEWLEFYVRDTGIGIPKAKQESIFDRFSQVETELNRKFGGTGLGLAICKNLINLLGGEIWVESVARKGSIFRFTLPINQLRAIEINKELPEGKTSLLKNTSYNWETKTILVAEDEELNYKVLDSCLSKTNARILRANDGLKAVELCMTEKIDLVLMDIQMPHMNGYEATLAIKKLNRDVPVIAQTSFAMADEREKCISAGCDDYITKPLNLDHLLEKIHQLMV
jgi:signal transduction histidine kinase